MLIPLSTRRKKGRGVCQKVIGSVWEAVPSLLEMTSK